MLWVRLSPWIDAADCEFLARSRELFDLIVVRNSTGSDAGLSLHTLDRSITFARTYRANFGVIRCMGSNQNMNKSRFSRGGYSDRTPELSGFSSADNKLAIQR